MYPKHLRLTRGTFKTKQEVTDIYSLFKEPMLCYTTIKLLLVSVYGFLRGASQYQLGYTFVQKQLME